MKNNEVLLKEIKQLKAQLADLRVEYEDVKSLLADENQKRKFYQLVSDFAFGWEIWFSPDGDIKYCSPSCYDLTGYTSNQIIAAESISQLLVYEPDVNKFNVFLKSTLGQTLVNKMLEFRILTRTKQLLWCSMAARGVYNAQGRYMGIRASVQNITRLKNAMGSIRELKAESEFKQKTQERLEQKISLKDRELVTFLLQLSQKNEILQKLYNILTSVKGAKTNEDQIKKMLDLIENQRKIEYDWGMLENQIDKLRPGFWERLLIKHPKLTQSDRKLCAYLLLGLSSKQISGLIGITAKSVEIARVRLRKKIRIQSSVRLVAYLENV